MPWFKIIQFVVWTSKKNGGSSECGLIVIIAINNLLLNKEHKFLLNNSQVDDPVRNTMDKEEDRPALEDVEILISDSEKEIEEANESGTTRKNNEIH